MAPLRRGRLQIPSKIAAESLAGFRTMFDPHN
jgi:hypothetical protein